MRAGVYLCLLASSCFAQSGSLEGELYRKKPTDYSHLVVRLETSGPAAAEQTPVSMSGDFRFQHLTQGTYTLVVADELGNEVTREQVNVLPTNSQLKVQLPEDSSNESPEGPVSVTQLRHKPEPHALRAAVKAQKLSASGDYSGAAAALEKAVALDPNFGEAHGNLGAQYVRLHQPARAATEFRKAIALDGTSSVQQANLALALVQIGQCAEALQWARHSLQIDSTNPLGHYILGYILAGENGGRTEAIRHLELASHTLPAAARMLEEIKR